MGFGVHLMQPIVDPSSGPSRHRRARSQTFVHEVVSLRSAVDNFAGRALCGTPDIGHSQSRPLCMDVPRRACPVEVAGLCIRQPIVEWLCSAIGRLGACLASSAYTPELGGGCRKGADRTFHTCLAEPVDGLPAAGTHDTHHARCVARSETCRHLRGYEHLPVIRRPGGLQALAFQVRRWTLAACPGQH